MNGAGRAAAAVSMALALAGLWRQADATPPGRPATTLCRPAALVDGRLVCGDASLAGLRALCPRVRADDGAAVSLQDCEAGRMPGMELLALGGTIDVNSAAALEIEALPGIGPTLARRIVEARPFRSVDDLERVSGIGVVRLAALRGHVRVGIPEPRRAVP